MKYGHIYRINDDVCCHRNDDTLYIRHRNKTELPITLKFLLWTQSLSVSWVEWTGDGHRAVTLESAIEIYKKGNWQDLRGSL